MADQIVKLVDDAANAGQKVDCATLTVGANTVVRQRICVSDPTTAAAVAKVTTDSSPLALTDSGLVVALSPNSSVVKYKARDVSGTVLAVKASAGVLYGIQVINDQASLTAYLQIFDLAAGSVVLGTTDPDLEFRIKASNMLEFVGLAQLGVRFSSAISIAVTTLEKGSVGSAAGVQVFLQYV